MLFQLLDGTPSQTKFVFLCSRHVYHRYWTTYDFLDKRKSWRVLEEQMWGWAVHRFYPCIDSGTCKIKTLQKNDLTATAKHKAQFTSKDCGLHIFTLNVLVELSSCHRTRIMYSPLNGSGMASSTLLHSKYFRRKCCYDNMLPFSIQLSTLSCLDGFVNIFARTWSVS